MFRLIALIRKEFLALLKDPKSRFVVIGPPIIQLLVFGYAATFDVTDVPLAVYNESSGEASRDLVARFEGSPNFRKVATITSDNQIAPLVDSRQALIVLHIGRTFARDLHRSGKATVQVILDGRDSNTALITLGYSREIINDFNVQWMKDRGLQGAPAQLEVRSWFNPNQESRWFIVPGIVGLLTLVVAMLVTALSVAREREEGTFDQLLVTPYQPWEILVGKAMPGLVIGVTEATFIVGAAVLWFQVPLVGSLVTLYVGIVLFVLAAIGVGLMISAISVTQQQALLGAFLFLVPAIILSGFSTPIANMPAFIQVITLFNPLRYFLVVLRSTFLEGTPIHLLLDQFWPMAAIAAFTLTSAAWLFRRRMY
ncbi:Inner membrane transport permease YbhR [Novipirellula aureliae]|uniref:Transport permease protein n=1 Tax=Novipirellula aureliae TaxID=2527966 RepID=A0A5C6DGV6_9BACT|nr:ABC transporter permease [Novipirellula aureliae]TWU35224.1 Inner membrane transport permease YbhR [Novipirellula aureliae]